MQFFAVLTGAAIGGIIAALATGDAFAFVVALVAGTVVYVVVGAALEVAGGSLRERLPLSWRRGRAGPAVYTRVLVLAVAAAAVGLSYVFVGAWRAVVAVALLVAAIVFGVLALLSGA